MGPIKPEEVQDLRDSSIPDEVFQIFNDLIVAKWDGNSARIAQTLVVGRISDALRISRTDVGARRYLDVESTYRKVGWTVEYDKPGYNETYEATFTFRKAR